jgi:hypothetical protein
MRLTSVHKLLLICLGALVFRLVLLQFVQFPGIADPNHYYNLGVRLVEGHGFTIDYIWQYNDAYPAIEHADDYWMPLTGVLPAVSMELFGIGVHQALLPFVLIGSLLPIIGYWAVRQFDGEESSALFAAAVVAVLPEFVLNSLRTDTTLPNALLLGASILLLTEGLKRGGWWRFAASGVALGLAYLTRSENLLMLVVLVITLGLYVLWKQPSRWRGALLVPLIAVLIALPWALRTLALNGTLSTPTTSNMFFLTDYLDHYFYDRNLTLDGYLASQTLGQIIGKRVFEIAASIKIMITTLDVFLPVAVIGGGWLVLRARSGEHWLTLAPTLILLLGFFAFYPILVPFKSQGGSFKKAYLSLIPLLLPLAIHALERAIADQRLRYGTMALVVALAAANAVDTVRLDAQASNSYLATIEKMVAAARVMPDTNGDSEILLMSEDPFIIRYAGLKGVIFPNEDRDTIIEVAHRYGVDYLLMPPNRPSLNGLLTGEVVDPRFVQAATVPGTHYSFYAIQDADE